jgi:hypothetical protein
MADSPQLREKRFESRLDRQMICVLTGLQQLILESQSVMNAVDGTTIERRI